MLLRQVTALLKESVDVNHLWVDQSVPARDMVSLKVVSFKASALSLLLPLGGGEAV